MNDLSLRRFSFWLLLALLVVSVLGCGREAAPAPNGNGEFSESPNVQSPFEVIPSLEEVTTSVEKESEVTLGDDNEEVEQDNPDLDWGYTDNEEFFSMDDSPREIAPLEIVGGLDQDVGNIYEGDHKVITIVLRNTSDEAWKLAAIDASCSCTNIDGLPGGMMMGPHMEWPMRVNVDGGSISVGNFTRDITVMPRDYKPVRIQLHGKVVRYYEAQPRNRQVNFGEIDDPAKPWEASILVSGLGELQGKMKLALPEKEDDQLDFSLAEQEPGVWKVTVKPKRPLPYRTTFSQSVKIPIVEPEGYPEVRLEVVGRSGMSLRFMPANIKLDPDKLAESGVVRFSTQLGFDPSRTQGRSSRNVQQLQDSYASNVDWDKFYEAVTYELPAGVECEKVNTRFGVRFDFTVKAEAFSNGEAALRIPFSAYGHPLSSLQIHLEENRANHHRSGKEAE